VTDFIAELEAELRSAAERRARRPRLAPPRRALVVLAMCLAALAVAAGAVRLLAGGRELPGGPPPGTLVELVPAVPVESCAKPDATAPRSIVPAALADMLGVLRRGRHEPDGLPALAGSSGGDSWVPLGAWSRDGVRRAGLGRLRGELHLVPGLAPDTDARRRCAELAAVPRRIPSDRPAVCLILGPAGGNLFAACFAPEQIRSGAAVALDGSIAYGVVPDGVDAVTLEAGGRSERADVVENVYEAASPARAGEMVSVRLEGGNRCGAGPDPALLNAVAALRQPPAPGANVPRAVLAAVPGRPLEDAARIAGGGDEITYWVVPLSEGGAPCAPGDRACVVPERDGRTVGPPVCADARRVVEEGALLAGPYEDRVIVYGLPRGGTARVSIDLDHEPAGGVDAIDGVAAGLLPEGVRWRDSARVDFTSEPARRGEGTVALLNGTARKGLATTAQGKLVERVPELLPAGGTAVGNTTSQQVERSEVLHLAGREAEAHPIGAALGISRVRAATREQLDDAGAPGSAEIAVILGADLRMR
jgi:hypothetical protein